MKPHFQPQSELARTLRQRVNAYLETQDVASVRRRMLLKTVVIGVWYVASYVLLLLVASEVWQAALLSLSLAWAMAAVGFNIEHDANHGAYPVSPRWQRALGYSLDVLAGSSYIWRIKHNRNHHEHTNVAGADEDIDLRPFGRLAPSQPRRWYHRGQELYLWPLYGLLPLKWLLWDDFHDVVRGKIGDRSFRRPSGMELVGFVVGKLAALTLWFGLPLLLHPWQAVLPWVLVTSMVLGITLAVVFQLAHAVDATEFPKTEGDEPLLERDWVMHQLATTANYAPQSRALGWLLGGLNHQVEHHLFPRVCHVHYHAIAPIVADSCREAGVPYLAYPTFGSALRSHYQLLRRMGRADAIAA
ncbi:MAG: acyl-CoA desaturase [Myxococcota bacterium]